MICTSVSTSSDAVDHIKKSIFEIYVKIGSISMCMYVHVAILQILGWRLDDRPPCTGFAMFSVGTWYKILSSFALYFSIGFQF